MYRIISGKWKGKKVKAPKNLEVRPTTDYAKEALFSILVHRFDLEFASALDLFAGIGSISLELASRNCKDITSVEYHRKHSSFILSMAKELDLDSQIRVINMDVFDYLGKKKNHGKKFDIVFADPPFDLEDENYLKLVNLILQGDFLTDRGLLIVEHQSKRNLESDDLLETRKYGNVSFSLYKPTNS